MGYTITIGEAKIDWTQDFVWIDAESAEHDDAPNHCPFTKKGNSRSPGYSAWSNFCEASGLTELFYGGGWDGRGAYRQCSHEFHRERGLLAEHPGAAPITQADADFVSQKLSDYKASYPNATPGFWDWGQHTNWAEVDNGKDPVLARLLWLDFWMRWAVENCENPVVANS